MRHAWNAFIVASLLAFVCVSGTSLADQEKPRVGAVAFAVAVGPSGVGIAMAQNNPDEFYVVLTNISQTPQSVWRKENSWAYKNISFEFTTPQGQKFVITEAPRAFTRNFPSTFVIEPGEHQVYAIRLDKWWESHPVLPKANEMSVTVKAIYEVRSTPEAMKYKVWTGRVESRSYSFTLRQW